MFENIPEDIEAQYLSGAAAFVRSNGDISDGVGKQDFMFILNEFCGLARVESSDDGRRSQSVVPIEEAGENKLAASEYTTTVFEGELEAWTREMMDDE